MVNRSAGFRTIGVSDNTFGKWLFRWYIVGAVGRAHTPNNAVVRRDLLMNSTSRCNERSGSVRNRDADTNNANA
jgi:hypothetical protein